MGLRWIGSQHNRERKRATKTPLAEPRAIGLPMTSLTQPQEGTKEVKRALGHALVGKCFPFVYPVSKCQPPTAVGSPPTAVGSPPTAVGYPLQNVLARNVWVPTLSQRRHSARLWG